MTAPTPERSFPGAEASAPAVPATLPRARALPQARTDLRFAVSVVLLGAVDWAAVGACVLATWEIREGLLRGLFPRLGPLLLSPRQYLATLYYLAPWAIAFIEAGLYSTRVLYWEEARRCVRACTIAAVFATLVAFATHTGQSLSRLVLAGTWLTSLFAVPIARHHAKRVLAWTGLWRRRLLIVGAGETGKGVIERIRRHAVLGYEPVGVVDDAADKLGAAVSGVPVLGTLADLSRIAHEQRVAEVLIAIPRLPRERLLHVIASCEGHVSSIRLVPDMVGVATVGVETEDLDGVLTLHMRWNLAKPWNLAVKRTFDLVLSSVLFLLLLPFLVIAAIAIRLDSPGPVLFRQDRLGRGWSRFRCIKFRTMYRDAAEKLERHLGTDEAARLEWEQYAKIRKDDPRVTRVGRVLRRLSFDELPQLVNVLRGDMSLVGPRPYLPSEQDRMGDFADTILKAPPGISGLWQVSGRNELSFAQRLKLDEYYVRNWSLWLDVIVLLKTTGVVVRRQGAY